MLYKMYVIKTLKRFTDVAESERSDSKMEDGEMDQVPGMIV